MRFGVLLVLLARPLGAQDAPPPKLEGAKLEQFHTLRIAALQATLERAQIEIQAQKAIAEKEEAALQAQQALAKFAREAAGGRTDCAPQDDGSWRCAPARAKGQETGDKGQD